MPAAAVIAAWLLSGLALFFTLKLRLLPALLAGCLAHELIHALARLLRLSRICDARAKIVAVALLSAVTVTALALNVWGGIVFFRIDSGSLPALLTRMAEIIDDSRKILPAWVFQSLPTDIEGVKDSVVRWLRTHAGDLQVLSKAAVRNVAHALIGLVVGALVALHEARPGHERTGFTAALVGRAALFATAFRRIVFAQVRISLINTAFTACYLGVVLPLAGVHLPFLKTMIAFTFLAGLLPVIGNLISNTVIVVVGLSLSLPVAAGALGYLVVIHKLEYFLNARIVGSRIAATAWELLLAMIVMEAAFGLAGVVAAPIYYAYLKSELVERGLVPPPRGSGGPSRLDGAARAV